MSERRFTEVGSDMSNRVKAFGHQAEPESVLPHKPKLEVARQVSDFMKEEIKFNPARVEVKPE